MSAGGHSSTDHLCANPPTTRLSVPQELQEYDQRISEWLCVRQSIKLTSVKPSGTISLVAGATPGLHYPESRFYIRRLRYVLMQSTVHLCRVCVHMIHAEAAWHNACVLCIETHHLCCMAQCVRAVHHLYCANISSVKTINTQCKV